MRSIKPVLPKNLLSHAKSKQISKAPPYPINTYGELVREVAHLSFLNKDYLLFFRGQTQDFKNRASASTFYPSIYRYDNTPRQDVDHRFRLLENASRQLVALFKQNNVNGSPDVCRKKYIQWSILQHYNVCDTPLLDFSHSLRVACSFAQQDKKRDYGYVYIFGLPYVTNRITINSEHDIVNVRLLSICPPDALRPYFQEGYLAGTTDITSDYESKDELDFNNRLIAKFVIPNSPYFWGSGLSEIPYEMLFPKNDCIMELCKCIEKTVRKEVFPGTLGEFLTEWAQIEQTLLRNARDLTAQPISVKEAIKFLLVNENIDNYQSNRLNEIRLFRNRLVHEPNKVSQNAIETFLKELRDLHLDI